MYPPPKDDSHQRIRNGQGSSLQCSWDQELWLICSSYASHHHHHLSSLVTAAGHVWVFPTAQAVQRGVSGHLFDRFYCAEVCALKPEHCNS